MTATAHAERIRAAKRAEAHQIGIDDISISLLVDRFYDRIQTDDLLGPIFAQHVADWSQHLPRMKGFWASIMIEPGS